jgi:hypothetical protein
MLVQIVMLIIKYQNITIEWLLVYLTYKEASENHKFHKCLLMRHHRYSIYIGG